MAMCYKDCINEYSMPIWITLFLMFWYRISVRISNPTPHPTLKSTEAPFLCGKYCLNTLLCTVAVDTAGGDTSTAANTAAAASSSDGTEGRGVASTAGTQEATTTGAETTGKSVCWRINITHTVIMLWHWYIGYWFYERHSLIWFPLSSKFEPKLVQVLTRWEVCW